MVHRAAQFLACCAVYDDCGVGAKRVSGHGRSRVLQCSLADIVVGSDAR
jgi:hypothetical protein